MVTLEKRRKALGILRLLPSLTQRVHTLGDRISPILAWVAVAFLMLGIVLSMFPVPGPARDVKGMNFAVVITAAVWGGAGVYYALDARRWYKGPRSTVDDDHDDDG